MITTFAIFSWQKYMPQLAAIFSHVIVDVSTIMALCIRWYPKGKLYL
jgi:oligoribonuclease (3'-5' exoribonuclease)